MFQVIWLQSALDELTSIWLQTDSVLRKQITVASSSIDELLRKDPENQGASRMPGQRVMFFPPLGVTFETRIPIGVVRVLHVWLIRQRTNP
jgi:hypothetical protein